MGEHLVGEPGEAFLHLQPFAVDPGRVKPGGLGPPDVGVEVIADMPGFLGPGADAGESMLEDLAVGLSLPELALDDDDIEVAGEVEALDLVALHLGGTVRQQANA